MSLRRTNIVDYRSQFAVAIVKMWRQSFQRAMGLAEQNQIEELDNQLDYFRSINPTNIRVAIERPSNRIAGFSVLANGELEHLYINVHCQGVGLGTKLLQEAKQRSPTGIELYTFQRNTRAQAFYEAHGFVAIESGFATSEGNPWATEEAQLADIKYRWAGEN